MVRASLLALLPLAFAAPQKRAPLITPRSENLVDGSYIVKLKPASDFSVASTSAIASIAADADRIYKNFGGFAASLTDDEVEMLRNNPAVEYIEQNQRFSIHGTQTNAPWGLARLSNVNPGSTTYTFDDSLGAGTCAYIVDTGIDITHPEFEGRASWGGNFADNSNTDGHGHGTHTAGTVGSRTYGVAKKTTLFAVKVLDNSGNGDTVTLTGGLDFVAQDAPSRNCPNGIVMNMSLGGGFSQAINDAAAGIVDAGIFAAVSAGNGDNLFHIPQDIATVSPGSEPSVCTVGASDINDRVASFSNYGALLDVYAPGVGVLSAAPGGGTATMDGTSMAAPHIAGLAAYYLGLGAAPASSMCEYIVSQGLTGRLTGVRSGTANVLAQN